IKRTLVGVRFVVAFVNIYVCEALWRSHISPLTRAGKLGRVRLERLVPAVRQVLEEAIAAGGSTLRDFANAEGGQGYFQHDFAVYGREGEPCRTPGCPGRVKRIVQAGRSTFFCSRCQT